MQFPQVEPESGGSGIDMTPMIDVVFLLVIFWMVVTAISTPDRDSAVLPPESEHATRDLAARRVVLQVRRGQGACYAFRDRLHDLAALGVRLRMLSDDSAGGAPVLGRPVLIRADGLADSRNVAALLGLLRRLGVRRVDFAARVQ